MNVTKEIERINLKELELGLDLKASWHYDFKDSNFIFVGNLPYMLSEGDILQMFSQYGVVNHVNMVRDKKSGDSKGFVFIGYDDFRSTVLAVDNFNKAELNGRVLRVDHTKEYIPPKDKRGCKVKYTSSESSEDDLDYEGLEVEEILKLREAKRLEKEKEKRKSLKKQKKERKLEKKKRKAMQLAFSQHTDLDVDDLVGLELKKEKRSSKRGREDDTPERSLKRKRLEESPTRENISPKRESRRDSRSPRRDRRSRSPRSSRRSSRDAYDSPKRESTARSRRSRESSLSPRSSRSSRRDSLPRRERRSRSPRRTSSRRDSRSPRRDRRSRSPQRSRSDRRY